MPKDSSSQLKLFMVDYYRFSTNKLLQSLGPFSEQQAKKVYSQWMIKDARCYADIRRATPQERGDG